MARLAPIDPQKADASLKPLFDDFIRERGAVPNMFRTLAFAPDLLKTFFAHFRAVLAEGEVPTRVKEMVAVRVSHLNGSKYCLGSHTGLAKRYGVTEQQVCGLQDQGKAEFAQDERAAIAYAEALTNNEVSPEVFAELRKHYGDRGIVEITAVACTFNYTNKFNTALDTELTVYPKPLAK